MTMRRLNNFDYFEPKTLDEACSLTQEFGDDAALLAGGTDILVQNKQRKRILKKVINLKKVTPSLSGITVNKEQSVFIGALTTMKDIAKSKVINEYFLSLATACGRMGSPIVRNLATLGGNIVNASPAAETAPPLLVLDAVMLCQGKTGQRKISAGDFFTGPGKTSMQPGEILVGFEIPFPAKGSVNTYQRFSPRKSQDLAVINLAFNILMDENKCKSSKISLGAVAPTPIRAAKAEKLLEGATVNKKLVKQVAEMAASEAKPISDIRSSAEYRQAMLKIFVERNLLSLFGLS